MQLIAGLRSALFFLTLLLLPTQLGKHFFLPFSYLDGVRVDYLSPTLYVIDILILLSLVLNIKTVFKFFRKRIFLLFLGLAAVNIFYSFLPPISFYGAVRILELLVLFSLGAQMFRALKPSLILLGLTLSGMVELLLSLLQLSLKHSLQGPFYYLGERLLSLSTPGVAKGVIWGAEFLRPYGTFSHPNSMAGFYLLIYFFILIYPRFEKHTLLKYLGLFVAASLVFISFSKVAILTFLVLNLIYLVLNNKKICRICVVARMAILIAVSLIFFLSQGDPLTGQKRLELMGNAVKIIQSHPIFGVGLNSYLVAQADFVSKFPLFFNQPVHNIYLLVTSELGLVTAGLLGLMFVMHVRKITGNQWILILAVAITGALDHYWLTLIQNFLLMGVVFSIGFQVQPGPGRSSPKSGSKPRYTRRANS